MQYLHQIGHFRVENPFFQPGLEKLSNVQNKNIFHHRGGFIQMMKISIIFYFKMNP